MATTSEADDDDALLHRASLPAEHPYVPPARWAVMRQDDNGNIYQVARHDERADAEAQISQLTVGRHKQLYWVADLQRDPK